MTPEQALQNLNQVASAHQADRQTHKVLEQSIHVLAEAIADMKKLKAAAENKED